MAKAESFRLIARHPEDLSDGRVVAPGETFKADPDDERVKQLVEDGAAIQITAKRSGGNNA